MKKFRLNVCYVLILFFGVSEKGFGRIHRIMYVGDSITMGKNCVPGFRDDVYQQLRELGFPFEFVGSVNESPPYRGFYFAGATTPEFYEKNGIHQIAAEMDIWKPTIVVIHLGSNDFWMETWIEGGPYSWDDGLTFSEHVSGHLARLVAYLAQWHDGQRGSHLETIILCRIIPKTWRHMGPAGIPLLNEELVRLVDDIESGKITQIPRGLIRLVDQFSTFTGDMFSDDNHPNCTGYRHMAGLFLDAFKTLPMYLKPGNNGDGRVLPDEALPDPVVFNVTDGFGKPVSNVPVHFEVVRGDAEILSTAERMTDSLGQAEVYLRMGWADSSIVEASASGLVDSIASWTLYPRDHVYLSGQVSYFGNDHSVPDVKLRWTERNQNVASDEQGYYLFEGVAIHESVTIVPSHEKSPADNINPTILDASVIARHVVGIQPLGEVPLLAADIDGSGDVTIEDAVTVARLVVGLEQKNETALGNWRFRPPAVTCDSVETDMDTLNFSAIQVGDLGSIWTHHPESASYRIELGIPGLGKTNTQDFVYTFPVSIHGEDLRACQFTVAWDTSEVNALAIERISPEFYVLDDQPGSGSARIAAFTGQSTGTDGTLINIRVRMKNGFKNPYIQITQARINESPVADAVTRTDIKQEKPFQFGLGANFPNPFNGQTQIPFTTDGPGTIQLSIFNVRGQRIKTLINENYPAGTFIKFWDGRDEAGAEAPSGIYLIRLENGHQKQLQRMELLR